MKNIDFYKTVIPANIILKNCLKLGLYRISDLLYIRYTAVYLPGILLAGQTLFNERCEFRIEKNKSEPFHLVENMSKIATRNVGRF